LTAPDFIEPLDAWRVWRVKRTDGSYGLESLVQAVRWPAGAPLEAKCLRPPPIFRRSRRQRIHTAPHEDCECGIYAAGFDDVTEYLAEASWRVTCVIGRVALWGTVIECERGFRAATAYPMCLYVPLDVGRAWRVEWEDVASDLLRYGVTVEALELDGAPLTTVPGESQVA
jgi:hypothetical protein